MKDWTVMIYLAGDNNLTEAMVRQVQSLAGVPLGENIAVTTQIDPSGKNLPTLRHTFPLPVVSGVPDLVATADASLTSETDTGTSETLADFIAWSVARCPAHKYALILSGHGSGVDAKHFLKDESSPDNPLTLPELRSVFAEKLPARGTTLGAGGKLDLIGFENCLMGMLEVGYELRHYVRYMVASEGLQSDTGWPYAALLTALAGNPTISPADWGQTIVHDYIRDTANIVLADRTFDLAVCDLAQLDQAAAALNNLAGELQTAVVADKELAYDVIVAHWKAQTYRFDQFTDIRDLCEMLAERPRLQKYAASCQAVVEAIAATVVKSCHVGRAYQYSQGLSVFFPWTDELPYRQDYQHLLFAREQTAWSAFTAQIIALTRRAPAPEPKSLTDEFMPLTREFMPLTREFMPLTREFMPLTRAGDGLPTEDIGSMKNLPLKFPQPRCI